MNVYESAQLVKIHQQEICQEMCNRPIHTKQNVLISWSKKIITFFT